MAGKVSPPDWANNVTMPANAVPTTMKTKNGAKRVTGVNECGSSGSTG